MKRFLITGATSGIGKEILLNLSKNYNFSATYRNEEKKDELEKKLINTDFFYLDLEKPELIEESIKNLNHNYDGLIYCAGLVETRPIKLSSYFTAVKTFNVNYFSFIELFRSLLKANKLSDNSSSIVISSVTSSIGEKGKTLYAGSKGALESSIRSLVKETSIKNHRINVIKPAMVNNMTLSQHTLDFGDSFIADIQKRQFLGLINNNDIIQVVRFLINTESKVFNGMTINLDGGWLL